MTPFISNQQKFTDNYNKFVTEYFKLLTQYYQNWTFPNISCTYYSIDLENSLMDETKLVGGAYQKTGDLTGLRWRKILNFPINAVEALSTSSSGDDKGVTSSDKMSSVMFPSSNTIEAHNHDFLAFTNDFDDTTYKLRNPPLFEIVNVEKSPDFDTTFYKASCKISYIYMDELDKRVDGIFNYDDYEKKLYGIDNSIILTQITDTVPNHCCNKFYNKNTGLYFDTVNLDEINQKDFT